MKLRLMIAAVVAAAAALVPVAASAGTPAGGTPQRCTATWNWRVDHTDLTQWSETEWTGNSCDDVMQDRSRCYDPYNNVYYYAYSGKVRGTYIWDRATCNGGDVLVAGALSVNGGSWYTYWHK